MKILVRWNHDYAAPTRKALQFYHSNGELIRQHVTEICQIQRKQPPVSIELRPFSEQELYDLNFEFGKRAAYIAAFYDSELHRIVIHPKRVSGNSTMYILASLLLITFHEVAHITHPHANEQVCDRIGGIHALHLVRDLYRQNKLDCTNASLLHTILMSIVDW